MLKIRNVMLEIKKFKKPKYNELNKLHNLFLNLKLNKFYKLPNIIKLNKLTKLNTVIQLIV